MISSEIILIFPIVKHWGFLLITLHFSACFHSSTTCLQQIVSSSSSQGCTAIYIVQFPFTTVYVISYAFIIHLFIYISFPRIASVIIQVIYRYTWEEYFNSKGSFNR